jgi:hypothetical protein
VNNQRDSLLLSWSVKSSKMGRGNPTIRPNGNRKRTKRQTK